MTQLSLEFSTQFDVLFSNITSNQAPGLNEYEKSIFLTKGQDALVYEHFTPRTDGVGGGFDGDQKRQYDFSSLVETATLDPIIFLSDDEKIDQRSISYGFPEDYYLSVNEIISDGVRQYSVMPLSYGEYQTKMLKPYAFPVKKGAWRLFNSKKSYNFFRDDKFLFSSLWIGKPIKVHIEATGDSSAINTTRAKAVTGGSTVDNIRLGNYKFMFSLNTTDSLCTIYIGLDEGLLGPTQCTDAAIVEALQQLFSTSLNAYVKDVADHLSGLKYFNVPENSTYFETTEDITLVGYEFNTAVKNGVVTEIIGKFEQDIPNYRLRYVQNLSPIILDNLSDYGTDLNIKGVSVETECKLPKECHQEIIERAVTLAKIAWQGSTATIASAAANQKGE